MNMQLLENEYFVPIKGYEGLYEISNYGRVKSLDRIVDSKSKTGTPKQDKIKGKLLTEHKVKSYPLCKNGIVERLSTYTLLVSNFLIENILRDLSDYLKTESLPNEIWKNIIGWEEDYQVSNLGRIRSIEKRILYSNEKLYLKKEKILKIKKNKYGYLEVTFSRNQKMSTYTVHRLVAISHISNPFNLPEVNHIDGVKSNNRVENLEWVTRGENQAHSYRIGLRSQNGTKNHQAIFKDEDIVKIREMYATGNYIHQEIADIYKTDRRNIGNIITRKTWKHII